MKIAVFGLFALVLQVQDVLSTWPLPQPIFVQPPPVIHVTKKIQPVIQQVQYVPVLAYREPRRIIVQRAVRPGCPCPPLGQTSSPICCGRSVVQAVSDPLPWIPNGPVRQLPVRREILNLNTNNNNNNNNNNNAGGSLLLGQLNGNLNNANNNNNNAGGSLLLGQMNGNLNNANNINNNNAGMGLSAATSYLPGLEARAGGVGRNLNEMQNAIGNMMNAQGSRMNNVLNRRENIAETGGPWNVGRGSRYINEMQNAVGNTMNAQENRMNNQLNQLGNIAETGLYSRAPSQIGSELLPTGISTGQYTAGGLLDVMPSAMGNRMNGQENSMNSQLNQLGNSAEAGLYSRVPSQVGSQLLPREIATGQYTAGGPLDVMPRSLNRAAGVFQSGTGLPMRRELEGRGDFVEVTRERSRQGIAALPSGMSVAGGPNPISGNLGQLQENLNRGPGIEPAGLSNSGVQGIDMFGVKGQGRPEMYSATGAPARQSLVESGNLNSMPSAAGEVPYLQGNMMDTGVGQAQAQGQYQEQQVLGLNSLNGVSQITDGAGPYSAIGTTAGQTAADIRGLDGMQGAASKGSYVPGSVMDAGAGQAGYQSQGGFVSGTGEIAGQSAGNIDGGAMAAATGSSAAQWMNSQEGAAGISRGTEVGMSTSMASEARGFGNNNNNNFNNNNAGVGTSRMGASSRNNNNNNFNFNNA